MKEPRAKGLVLPILSIRLIARIEPKTQPKVNIGVIIDSLVALEGVATNSPLPLSTKVPNLTP